MEQQLTLPFGAPRTILNVPIGGARRCAAQSWPMERVMAIKQAAGVTVNDVVLAMCGGALRAYLIEQNALPDKPLIAMVPVSLRDDANSSGGNQVGALLASLATDLADPEKRLEVVSTSMRSNKEVFAQLPKLQQMALSAFNVSPLLLMRSRPPWAPRCRPSISRSPTSRERESRCTGMAPAWTVTIRSPSPWTARRSTSRCPTMPTTSTLGWSGRRSVPSLQRLLGHLEDSLTGLEEATGVWLLPRDGDRNR